MLSCNKEELFAEPTLEVVDPKEDPDEETDTNLPCNFTLDNVEPNSTIIIDCLLDLKGQTVNLPANVTIEGKGGDIINGTINFSEGNNVIDGNLLSSNLTITGNSPHLKDPVFKFNPKRWGIVEGVTTSENAQKNNDILESSMKMAKELGVTTFQIDKMDAYFEVSKVTSTTTNRNFYPSEEAVNVPSNFTLSMGENVHLRVQPNSSSDYALLALRDVSNARVEGGNLHGDRLNHDDSKGVGNSGHVIMIHGSNNIDIDNVRMINGTGDGLNINSIGFTFEAGYIPSNNIRVTNNTLDSNRRNNISITDGFNILIDSNNFLNAGIDLPNSKGVAPGFGLDVEAVRRRDTNGEFILYEKAYNITLSNNIEKGSKYGAFIVAIGEDVTIENNTTENSINIADGSGVKILNNEITAKPGDTAGAGIITGHPDSTTASNNIISGNTINGYTVGIAVYTRENEIYNNKIINFVTGVQPKNVKDINIYKNTFESNLSNSVGIFGNITSMDNVKIYENNFVKTGREGIKMVMVNNEVEESNNKVIIDNNDFKQSSITISRTKNVDFINNTSKKISLLDAQLINLYKNTIDGDGNHAIEILSGCRDIDISENVISVTGNNNCVYQPLGSVNIFIDKNDCSGQAAN
ncbi:hypothetical protein A8C32_03495 [Flavivirga aquatica]|uniref:Right handed beta helix domain-containing protein n=2 Tax=Flavivirga aquatica TaxID=1849968 RepID=A0A1E5TAZ3_9FLAO|nr:hypothetical protein A8C32_03495 [Flavivirga aquatica]